MSYLGLKNDADDHCENCDSYFDHDVNYKNGDYFVVLPVKEQVVNILKTTGIENNMISHDDIKNSYDTSVIKDIVHGKIYKDLIGQGRLGPNDLSLLFNTDGISVFKSSNYSVWPILATVNELPPHLRKDHMILAGLWFGAQKPHMNTFFKPFVTEMIELGNHGLCVGNVCRKVFALFLSADAPARAILRNCKQFNGACGCDWCEQEGTTIKNMNGPPIRVYPYERNVPQKSDMSQRRAAIVSQRTGECHLGTKGPSLLFRLPNFDFVWGGLL